MTIKEEFELLRGCPIKLVTPIDKIPCNETSDLEKLCKHPTVSVHMLAYNHEAYIAQAIEGVMMQETDFEYELVIGEDASPDRTREICFDYQKRYPDKIRVLWSEENVTKPYGGNAARVMNRCRGEFIAFCEGDDYWIDPKKLQKQVDAMRTNPSVGLVHCGAKFYWQDDGEFEVWKGSEVFPAGFIKGKYHFSWQLFGMHPETGSYGKESFIMTATTMVRRSVLDQAVYKYAIFNWRLYLGDLTLWLAIASLSDVYFIKEPVAVYRRHRQGACATSGAYIWCDSETVRIYFARLVLGLQLYQLPTTLKNSFILSMFATQSVMGKQQRERAKQLFQVKGFVRAFVFSRYSPFVCLLGIGCVTKNVQRALWRFVGIGNRFLKPNLVSVLYK